MQNKKNYIGALSPQEAFDYAVFTYAVEGIVFTDDEKEALLNNLNNGTCGQAAEQAVLRFREKYSVV